VKEDFYGEIMNARQEQKASEADIVRKWKKDWPELVTAVHEGELDDESDFHPVPEEVSDPPTLDDSLVTMAPEYPSS
jgi:hypothetical protein